MYMYVLRYVKRGWLVQYNNIHFYTELFCSGTQGWNLVYTLYLPSIPWHYAYFQPLPLESDVPEKAATQQNLCLFSNGQTFFLVRQSVAAILMLLLLLVIKGNTDQLVCSSGNLGQKRREGNHRIFVEMALFYVFNEEEEKEARS